MIAGVLAALGSSICCVGPLVLLGLGVGGTWISSLTAFEPYRPVFILLTILFLGLVFYRLYFRRVVCAQETICADLCTLKRQRLAFWIVTILVLALISVPWLTPLFYSQ
jgi:mercuric ion transport protein